jgi:NAD(P)-dependent dehydrogenase (short-subunit alcohol dehydrogenase family)
MIDLKERKSLVEKIPRGRRGPAEAVADLMVFMASDRLSYGSGSFGRCAVGD